MSSLETVSIPLFSGETRAVPHLGRLLRDVSEQCPDKEAIVFSDRRWRYGELFARSIARGASFRALGLRHGTHVGIWGGTAPEQVELVIGASMAGLVAVVLSARYKADEISYVVSDSDIAVLFTFAATEFADFPAMLSGAFPDMAQDGEHAVRTSKAPHLRRVYVVGGSSDRRFNSYDSFVGLATSELTQEIIEGLDRLSPKDNLVMLYTSGTTAHPKGVLLTHVNVVGKALNFAPLYHMDSNSRFWDPLPGFHIGFIWPLIGCFAARATFVTMQHFEPGAALDMLEQERITHAYPAFQPLWQPVINHSSFGSRDLSALKALLHVGTRNVLDMAQSATPHALVVSAYGITEGCGTVTHPDPGDPEDVRLGTEGIPLPGVDIRIVSLESGKVCNSGEIGELQLRGYCIASGYYHDPAKTAECFLPDGWFRTGDLGAIDAHGRLSYKGRFKDMLKVGGENVAALEIEQALSLHPAVACAQVIGVADEKYQEVAAAFVELMPGKTVTGEELIQFCAPRIARFKLPRFVTFVTAWPMSATKIQKHRLRELPLGPRLIA